MNKLRNVTTQEYLVQLEWLATKLLWEMETRLKFIFEHNFFEQTARPVRLEDKFFRIDSPSRSNGYKFSLHGYPEPLERLMHDIRTAIHEKTANRKERFCVKGHIF